MNVQIRNVKENDFNAIYVLNRDSLGYNYDIDSTHKNLKHIIHKTKDTIFVAELDGTVVGYIHASDYECTYANSLKNIMALAVIHNKQGLGIGRMLLDFTEIWAKEEGADGMRLISGCEREDAHNFYIACGYSHRKNHKNFVKLFK